MYNSETVVEYKAISSKGVLAKVVSQFGFAEYNLLDGIELIYEAIEAIGYHIKKVYAEEEVEVTNFIIEMPANFVSFRKLLLPNGEELCKGLSYENGFDCVNGNWTYTKREGILKLQYLTSGTDEEGFPLVRDTFKYREAISYFLLLRFFEAGNKHPTLDIRYAQQEFTKYRLKAKNEWIVTPEMVEYIVSKWDYESISNNQGITTSLRYTDRDNQQVSSVFTGVRGNLSYNYQESEESLFGPIDTREYPNDCNS